jgi:hypothetical protein
MTRLTKRQQVEREEAKEKLRAILKPGDTVYTILRHRAASGMSRVIDLAIPYVDDDGKAGIRTIGWQAATALDDRWNSDKQGIVVGGCGMDMGFHLVYNLGHVLWPQGTDKPHGTRNGEPDSDGGYALKHRWL